MYFDELAINVEIAGHMATCRENAGHNFSAEIANKSLKNVADIKTLGFASRVVVGSKPASWGHSQGRNVFKYLRTATDKVFFHEGTCKSVNVVSGSCKLGRCLLPSVQISCH